MWSIKIKIGQLYLLYIVLDESRDIIDTNQFLIFILGINNIFETMKELLSAYPMKDTTTGEDFFYRSSKSFSKNI